MSARFCALVAHVAVCCSASVPAAAQDGPKPTLIVGTLLGTRDEPLKVATVALRLPHAMFPFAESTVGPDGRFAIAATVTGGFLLVASGVDHLRALVPFVIDTPRTITVHVRLPRYTYTDSLDRVVAIGDWNKFDFASGRPLVKQPDGRYTPPTPALGTHTRAMTILLRYTRLSRQRARDRNSVSITHSIIAPGSRYGTRGIRLLGTSSCDHAASRGRRTLLAIPTSSRGETKSRRPSSA